MQQILISFSFLCFQMDFSPQNIPGNHSVRRFTGCPLVFTLIYPLLPSPPPAPLKWQFGVLIIVSLVTLEGFFPLQSSTSLRF